MQMVRRVLCAVLAATVAALAVAGCGRLAGTSGSPTTTAPGTAFISRVVDGDTVSVNIGGKKESVRLIGVDTPESVKPGTPVQCFALEASARTKALLPSGTPVRLEADVEQRDRYGRLLAYVDRLRDALCVNTPLVDEGFAVPSTVPPNVAHASEFVAGAAAARRAGLGLWSRCGDAIPQHDAVPLRSPP